MYVTRSTIQPHNNMLPVSKGEVNIFMKIVVLQLFSALQPHEIAILSNTGFMKPLETFSSNSEPSASELLENIGDEHKYVYINSFQDSDVIYMRQITSLMNLRYNK